MYVLIIWFSVVVVVRLPRRLVAPLRAAPAAFSLPSSPRCASPSPANDSSKAETSTTSPVEKRASPLLFVGLGNTGSKYQGTRHNVERTLSHVMPSPR
ncbi:hypothetical protein R1flu_009590 [Riccia fluitans]|uniref:Peptidyl-tRNA hydrolase n=1 Tax=Riccia fluitans TaxID=41844 RepID=A0ABD1Z3D4_9MARC